MSDKILVYSVSGYEGDVDWISNYEMTDKIEEAQVVVFPGGADIDPKLYGFEEHPKTYYSKSADERDLAAYNKMNKDQLAVGICRGAQFLCAMNGGKLIQDVKGHSIGKTHQIYTKQRPQIELHAISLHHQMMYPFNLPDDDYTLLYVASCGTDHENITHDLKTGRRLDLNRLFERGEPEVVLFHKENTPLGLAIQSHPEMMRVDSGFVKEMNKIITKLLEK